MQFRLGGVLSTWFCLYGVILNIVLGSNATQRQFIMLVVRM